MKLRFLFLFCWVTVLGHAAEPRDAQWRQVQDAMDKGLPKTALETLAPILAEAIREGAWAEATKAIGRRIALETQIEGRPPEGAIKQLAHELERVPPALQPVFHTLLGNAYWAYFRQNQWRFAQRTTTATPPGTDFTTWDLRRLFSEIDRHFQSALANDAVLKATPIAQFDALLEKGTVPDSLRPTLYDFLAFEALAFYQAGEQGLARPEDAFIATADSPILGSLDAFLRWRPSMAPSETNAPTVRAIVLFQALLRHHTSNPDPGPRLDADIQRLTFAHRIATGPDKDDRFVNALLAVADRWPQHELSARARQAAARAAYAQGNLSEAHRHARQASQAFPNSLWTRDSRNLIAEIEAPQLSISTETSWTPPWPTLEIDHRNITKVWFRAIPADWAHYLDRRLPRPERLNRTQRLDLLSRAHALEWSVDLPATRDFRQRRHVSPAPTTLPPGFYFIFASHQADFPEAANELSVTTVWVSELALISRSAETGIEGFVVDANTGEPRPGATVEAWFLAPGGARSPLAPQTTDALGFFHFPEPRPDRGHLLRARLGDHQIALIPDVWWNRFTDAEHTTDREQTLILTDRALYRPGQSIHYKGIAVHTDNAQVRYELRAGRELTLVFRDSNHQEIARRTVRTSDLGSFSGNFTAPRDRLPGRMSIDVEGDSSSPTWFSIEEYKRPKFQVILDPPTEAPRLNDTVTWTGRALAYTGAPVDQANIRWRVRRLTRFPIWWGLFRPGPGPGVDTEQEIAHGVTTTAPDGSFAFRCRVLADPSALEADEPTFDFQVQVDVTDAAGETRSAERSVPIGYAALAAQLDAADWQSVGQAVAIQIATRTLDGTPLAAAGTLKVHRLEQPSLVHRPSLRSGSPHRGAPPNPGVRELPLVDLSNPNQWRLGPVAAEQPFQTSTNGVVTNRFDLPAGIYRAVLATQDRFGRKVTSQLQLRVLDPDAAQFPLKIPNVVDARAWEVEPGQEFLGLWGTGYDTGRAFVEIKHRGKTLERFWTTPDRTQQRFTIAVTESMRGGFSIAVTQVRENRAYVVHRDVQVPWKNKELDLAWETFRSKLEPGRQETWTAVLKAARPGTADAEVAARSATEMVAALYDASLDQFLPHEWPTRFDFWPQHSARHEPRFFSNTESHFDVFQALERRPSEDASVRYRAFPADLRFERPMRFMARTMTGARGPADAVLAMAAPAALADAEMVLADSNAVAAKGSGIAPSAPGTAGANAPSPTGDLALISPRRNLAETAFFFPHLTSDSNGVVRISFTVPEALTEWRFLGFAHDRSLRSGRLHGRAVTAKEIMVQPNPPRFLREGDELEFTVKVVNASEAAQSGRIRLSFAFAQDSQSADAALENTTPERAFEIPAKESRTLGWRLRVPDGCGFLAYKAVAATARHSDGEEGFLPVLARRVLVTESLPLPMRGPGTRSFDFTRLRNAGTSATLRHQSLSVQMASHPAWYAVLALPYLMEYPHECAEQVFNRLHANALARHIAQADPRIRRVFDQWRATPALESPLEKNPDLKAAALAETPWVRDAQSESEARRNVGTLFEANRLDAETQRALHKLGELLLPDGAWPWFPGGPRNDFISLYIVSGFGRLRQLGVDLPVDLPVRALSRIDAWMNERYQDLKQRKLLDRQNIDATVGLYVYARSFFLTELPLTAVAESTAYWLRQGREHWLKTDRQTQAHLALAFSRFGNATHHDAIATANAIAASLKERSILSDEMGRSWNDTEAGWWWYRAPIETQALMIEVFQVVTQDTATADECRLWLLKQKQTQHWKSTKATADAVYATVLGGPSWLGGDALVQVGLGGRNITPDPRAGSPDPKTTPEPGTGFYQVRIPVAEIRPELASITVHKSDPGIAWGSVHWQYFEDLARIPAFDGTPLKLSKRLFTRTQTRQGPQLQPVSGPVRVGDELVVRIELRVDRDMEFVHLKDLRGSGTEPVHVLSGYRFQDGLGYYEAIRDTASHFFIDHLPKGTYVFEYPLRVQHKGTYPTGVAEVQCLYAPEFNSHSESLQLQVR